MGILSLADLPNATRALLEYGQADQNIVALSTFSLSYMVLLIIYKVTHLILCDSTRRTSIIKMSFLPKVVATRTKSMQPLL